ncbi:glycosyl transferase family 90 [Rhodopila sp.]|uniref:glycosyl transferase family 90 n=1 Tax=Rhodopila sp. TaxID=2480087 RepID=UPI003D0CDFAA
MATINTTEASVHLTADGSPNDQDVALAIAWLAFNQREWTAAAVRWADIRLRFPDNRIGYLIGAQALQAAGAVSRAVAVLADARRRWPDDLEILAAAADLAHARGDYPAGIRIGKAIIGLFPGESAGYFHAIHGLRHLGKHAAAEAVLSAATQRCLNDRMIASMHVESLPRRGAAAEADATASHTHEAFPNHPAGDDLGVGACQTMNGQTGIKEIPEIMHQRLPNDPMAQRLSAQQATERREWAVAEACWTRFREQFPDDPAGYIGGALVRRETGWPDGSDALLAQGIASQPRDIGLLTEYAHNAMRRKDWNEAVRRWETFRLRLPDSHLGYLGGAGALRDAGQFEVAEALLRGALTLFPDEANLAGEYVNLARIRGDVASMIERSRQLAERFPDRVDGAVSYAEALSVEGRHAEAETILLDAQRRFPDQVEPFAEFAQVAIRQGAWIASLERWQAAQRRFPRLESLSHRIFEARMRVAEVDPESTAEAAVEPVPQAATPAMKEIVEDFESLGGAGHGCEFGLFQRTHGAEPLGLLRWADLGADLLIAALEAEFEGVGLPENTLVFTPPTTGRSEYWTRDKRYWMAMRCFIMADEVAYEKMVTQACRRIQFLRRKLIDDLQAGEKIFVFKSIARNLTDAELARLHNAARRYGDNALLYVRYEDAANPNGSVRVAGPGLMIGYVDRFAFSPDDRDLGPAVDRWAAICTKAHAIWKSGDLARATPGEVAVSSAPIATAAAKPAEAEPSRGQRLISGPGPDRSPVILKWSAAKVAEARQTLVEQAPNTREQAFASIVVNSLDGDHAAARGRIGKLVDDFAIHYPHDDFMFEGLLLASVISGQWDLAPRLLRDRFGTDWCAAVDVEAIEPPAQTMRWEIDPAGKSRFHLNAALFASDRTWIELFGWSRSMTLFHDYTTAPAPEHGSVLVSLGDSGATPGLAPSEYRPGYFLIPDPVFLNTNAYSAARTAIDAAWVPWNDRAPIAFWRGASTGQLRSNWRNLPRMKLCLIARQAASAGLIDAAITSFVGLPAAMLQEAEAAGLGGDFVRPTDFTRYKYQIDIDGNTNAWAALFQKLLTGSPVLKVRSPFGYRQWYYDDLIPWENYVPVEPEMHDLIEKIRWLREHDDHAQRIGQAGLALARSMSRANELKRVRPTISAAIRCFSGRPDIVIPFGAETDESRFLIDGWSGIFTASGATGRYALGPESRIKFPRPMSEHDMELRLSLAAPAPANAFRMITVVNGLQVDDVVVTSPRDVVSTVPASTVARGSQTTITLLFPDLCQTSKPALPAVPAMAGLLFTGLQMTAK